MVIYTDEGKVETKDDSKPVWNDVHKRFYVWGYRWIKTRKAFSTVCTLHNFTGWTEDSHAIFSK